MESYAKELAKKINLAAGVIVGIGLVGLFVTSAFSCPLISNKVFIVIFGTGLYLFFLNICLHYDY